MHFKRIISFLLAGSLVLSLTVTSVSAINFSDTEGHWAENAIQKWSEKYGIIEGDNGEFRPNDSITRAEMATILNRIMCYQTTVGTKFADVSNEWFADAVLKLNAAGVMLGDETYIRPNDKITREEAVVLLARAFRIDKTNSVLDYADSNTISSWATQYVSAMTQKGYIQGMDNKFNPKDNLTRAQAVTIFDNIIAEIYSKYSKVSADIDGSIIVNSTIGVELSNMTINGDLIICPNVISNMTLDNITITGKVKNYSNIVVTINGETTEPDVAETIQFGTHTLGVFKDVPKNSYLADGYYTENGFKKYQTDDLTGKIGIDVSSYQGTIDWKAVKAAGVDYAMIRLGFTGWSVGSLNLDKTFKTNIAGATAAGLDVGIYYFSQAISVSEAVAESNFVISNLKGYNITYPVVFDWETVNDEDARTNDITTETLDACAVAFCETVKAEGYHPMVYFNTYIGLLMYNLSSIKNYDFWFAGYTDLPTFYYDFKMWQYTSSGKVNGVPTSVDVNISFVDYSN